MPEAICCVPPEPPRTFYAIGDVHGCPGMLEALLADILADAAAAGGANRPRLVMLGDLVDRGPDSMGVVDIVLSDWFSSCFDATILRGNHEDMLNCALSEPDEVLFWLRHGGAETVESYGVEFGGSAPAAVMRRFADALPPAHRRFLANLPFSQREGGHFMVHAGVRPKRPLHLQSPTDLMWIREEFLRHRESFGAIVVHGHSPTDTFEVEVRRNRIAVDTGCGYPGGRLSAAAVGPDGSVRALSVGPAPEGELDLPRSGRSPAPNAVRP